MTFLEYLYGQDENAHVNVYCMGNDYSASNYVRYFLPEHFLSYNYEPLWDFEVHDSYGDGTDNIDVFLDGAVSYIDAPQATGFTYDETPIYEYEFTGRKRNRRAMRKKAYEDILLTHDDIEWLVNLWDECNDRFDRSPTNDVYRGEIIIIEKVLNRLGIQYW